VTLAYVLVSLIGLAFSGALLRESGLNVFSFADVTDFLMAAFRDPMTFALSLSALLLGLIIHRLARWEVRWPEKRNPRSSMGRRHLAVARASHASFLHAAPSFVLCSAALVYRESTGQAEAIPQENVLRIRPVTGPPAP
jgi:hypothetical protein